MYLHERMLSRGFAGVVILHLLLIPGTAFLAGGAQIWEQNLHPHPTELNHSLLAIGFVKLDRLYSQEKADSTTQRFDYPAADCLLCFVGPRGTICRIKRHRTVLRKLAHRQNTSADPSDEPRSGSHAADSVRLTHGDSLFNVFTVLQVCIVTGVPAQPAWARQCTPGCSERSSAGQTRGGAFEDH